MVGRIHLSCPRTDEGRERCTRFVQETYLRTFGTVPGPAPWYVAAYSPEGKILAVLGLQVSLEEALPIERLYRVPGEGLPPGYDRGRVAYYSRLVSFHHDAIPLLFHVATCHAVGLGCRHGSAVFLGYMHRCFSGIGCGDVWRPVAGAVLDMGAVPDADRSYFLNPDIGYYVADLSEKVRGLQPFVRSVLGSGLVSWDQDLDPYLVSR